MQFGDWSSACALPILKEVQHILVGDKREAVCWLANEMVMGKEDSRMGIEGHISQKHHASY